ncbi:hypothetical protein CLOM_g16540 [Closterium sp. NIES-68]|nr:hypothetical protein CLOM_g16540 [Closterium sp. NIES-68]GJP58482.1 hypothetical protein CLOP_g83 [Closterium sp. NIES-67]
MVAVAASDLAWLLLVGAVWGITNPLIKRGAAMSKKNAQVEIDAAAKKSPAPEGSRSFPGSLTLRTRRFFHVLARDWQYYTPLCINLSGSLLFFATLRGVHVSLAVPVSNGATFAFNAAAAYAFGEKIQPGLALVGISLGVLGIALCV